MTPMIREAVDKVLVELPAGLRSILEVIESNGLGIVFTVDRDGKLLGSITDGDVRRALLGGATIDDRIDVGSPVQNRKPHALPVRCEIQDIWALLERGYRCIPLTDPAGRVVDIATRSRVRRFPVVEPDIGERELSNLVECGTTGWISSQGRFIVQFENAFAEYLGGGHALAVCNGTVALHLALVSLGIAPGDEVIVPNFTFGASVNSIIHAGATPVLVDVHRDTWTLDPALTEAAVSPRTRAIMPVHVYGQPAHIDELNEIARRHSLHIVEDCAESLGAQYKGRRVGRDGSASCFSFFANKVITTGEGGMVLFKDPAVAAHAKVLRDHGMRPGKRYWHDHPGFNYRMTNLQAAIGVAQLERIEDFRCRRKAVFDRYDRLLAGLPAVSLLPKNKWSENSYWLYTVIVHGVDEVGRDRLIERLLARGVDTRPGFYPMHAMQPYAAFARGSYSVSTDLATRSISLPSSPALTESEQAHIAEVFLDELKSLDAEAA